jgi:hypothetical protein
MNVWQFSNLAMRMHKLLFPSRQFPYHYKADDEHFKFTDCCSHILMVPIFKIHAAYCQQCILSAPQKQHLSILVCSKRKQLRGPSTHSGRAPECTWKPAGWPGSGNINCMPSDIAVHYFCTCKPADVIHVCNVIL